MIDKMLGADITKGVNVIDNESKIEYETVKRSLSGNKRSYNADHNMDQLDVLKLQSVLKKYGYDDNYTVEQCRYDVNNSPHSIIKYMMNILDTQYDTVFRREKSDDIKLDTVFSKDDELDSDKSLDI